MKKYFLTFTVILSVALVWLMPASAAVGLSVPLYEQQQEQWCWAGASQMILAYYGTSTAQCTMANYCFGQSSCCNNVVWPSGTGSYCNKPNWIYGYGKDMAEVLSHYGSITGTGTAAALSWSTLVSEINGGHPFVIGFTWNDGGGHALVGRGYYDDYRVRYVDPWPGEGYMVASYNWMVNSPGSGGHVWDESYTTRSSSPILAGGDYNGDGHDDIAIFRPSTGLWSIRGITRIYWGTSGDIPVPGNYGGYGKTDIGIFRPSSGLWALKGYLRYYYGSSSDTPVPGDYNGNGACNLGIYRPSTGLWSLRGFTRCYFGGSSDTAVPANFQGGSADEIAIFRPSSGLWAIKNGYRYYFGRSGDIPVTR